MSKYIQYEIYKIQSDIHKLKSKQQQNDIYLKDLENKVDAINKNMQSNSLSPAPVTSMHDKILKKWALVPVVLGLIYASNWVYDSYSFLNDSYFEDSVQYNSFLLKINTAEHATCKYSTSDGILYDDMANFDLSSGSFHEKSFNDLGDGIYKYYVKCDNGSSVEPKEMEIVLRVNPLVSAQISLSEEAPLRSGRIDLDLLTSKIVSQTPTLTSL